ncbi:Abscission/NoCut checkpoint regulator [Thoreauomyces humboldtii]|nr:Abscission/NoCut checkpoint regulator [Thoreauomyces humboldtii]
MSDPDKELLERFEKLKASEAVTKGALPSDDELARRLKELTGKDPVALSAPLKQSLASSLSNYAYAPSLDAELASILQGDLSDLTVDLAYEDEKINVPSTDPLIPPRVVRGQSFDGQFVDYTTMLLTSPTKPNASSRKPDLEDDDEVNALIQEIGHEVQLEEKFGVVVGDGEESQLEKRMRELRDFVPTVKSGTAGAVGKGGDLTVGEPLGEPPRAPSLEDFENPVEEQWCCICNDDAVLICVDCDEDYYCQNCFREGHMDAENRRHIAKKVARPAGGGVR